MIFFCIAPLRNFRKSVIILSSVADVASKGRADNSLTKKRIKRNGYQEGC